MIPAGDFSPAGAPFRLSPCPEGVRREAVALAAVVDAQAVYRGAALARTAVAS